MQIPVVVASTDNRRRQRHLTCYRCNKPESKAVICSRDGPARGGYCLPCFDRYLGEFFRSGFFRHCGMMSFLQDQDRNLLSSFSSSSSSKNDDIGNNNNNTLSPNQITCASTKIIVAVSGSYSSMALLVQLAALNKEISEKYLMITQNGKKMPPQGKNVLVRPMELAVVHLTRFNHGENQTESEMSAEDAEAFRVEKERTKQIYSLVAKLNNSQNNIQENQHSAANNNNNANAIISHVIIQSVAEANTSTTNNNSTSLLVEKCFYATSNPHSQTNKAIPLSVREDIYRCLTRNGLLNVAKKINAQVICLGQNATSSSWEAINDVTRGRGAGLFESNGYFCDVVGDSDDINSSSSSKPNSIKFIRPLVGIAARELTLFCTILNRNKSFGDDVQNCSVDNPTSFSPSVPSIDRALEDFVLNLTKSFASTSFNVAKTIEKVNAINFMRRIEGNEDIFMNNNINNNNNNNTSEESIIQQQENILDETKKWKNCKLCVFSKVFTSDEHDDDNNVTNQNKNDDDDNDDDTIRKNAHPEIQRRSKKNVSHSDSLCHGCQDSIFLELESLSRNLPVAGAKQQSQSFLDLLRNCLVTF